MEAQSRIQFRKFDFAKKLDLDIDIIAHAESYLKESVSKQEESIQWRFESYLDVMDGLIEAAENPKLCIYHNFNVNPTIFSSMGLLPFSAEALTFFSPVEYAAAYKDRASAGQIPEHLCSYLGPSMGMVLSNALPKPAGIVYASHPCDSTLATCQALSEHYGVPAFLIDAPYGDSKRDHDYFNSQIKEVFQYLEKMTGKKLELNNLREAVKKADKAHELNYQIDELKKMKPCPLVSGGNMLRVMSIAMYMGIGKESTIHWLEKVLEDVKERAEKGIGGKCEEKLRIAWINNMPSFDPAIYEWMEERYGARSVILQGAEETYWPTFKPERKDDYDYSFDELFRILTDQGLNTPMARQHRGHYNYYVRDCVHWCRDWDIDAAIFSGQIMCKGPWAIAQLTKEILMDELDVPTLMFGIDPVDPRVTSAEQIIKYMEPFLDMVAENKGL